MAEPEPPADAQPATPPTDQPVTAHADQPATPPADQPATPSTDQSVLKNEEKQLKYLDFVQVAAIYMVLCCSTVYEYAKENSGTLKPGVEIVEGTVKTIIGPVYEKFQNVPSDLLKFVDRKVDESLNELEHHVPALLKQLWSAARELALEVQQDGLVDTVSNIAKSAYDEYEPRARELYIKYEPTAEQYAMTAWRTLNGLPLFAQAAHIMIPTAAYWAEKYNQSVAYAGEKGYTMSYYLPLLPIDKIAKIFGAENEPPVSRNGEFAALS